MSCEKEDEGEGEGAKRRGVGGAMVERGGGSWAEDVRL